MKKMFLDPNKTPHTCMEKSCDNCKVTNNLACHFNGKQLFVFLLLNFPLFICAGFLIYQFNAYLLIPWLLFMFSYFLLIEIRVMCSHCPHYAEPGIQTLKCWANYGSPKLWKYRPGPMSTLEKVVFILGLSIILLPPAFILLVQGNYLLLSLYILLLVAWKIGLRTIYCKHCINFACPFNAIDDETRESFFDKNPIVKNAWKK